MTLACGRDEPQDLDPLSIASVSAGGPNATMCERGHLIPLDASKTIIAAPHNGHRHDWCFEHAVEDGVRHTWQERAAESERRRAAWS